MTESDVQPWTTVASREVYRADPWLVLTAETVQLPDGALIQDWLKIALPDAALIVAVTAQNQVVAEREYRHGAGRVALGLPAGAVEHGELPLAAAQRELLEETGYASAHWTHLGSFVKDGNRGCGQVHIFLALDAELIAEPDSGDLGQIQVLLMPLADLERALFSGELEGVSAASAIALASVYLRRPSDGIPA